MSKFSGKCDFADQIEMFGYKDAVLNGETYIGKDRERVVFESENDLVLYYPYVPGIVSMSDGKCDMWLGEKSYITNEERNVLNWYLDDAQRALRSLKRKKTGDVTPEAIFNKAFPDAERYSSAHDVEVKKEIARRVFENGKKATADGLSVRTYDYYRKEWKKEILNHGFSEEFADEWIKTH